MEKTVENHVKQAVFCFENGDFNRAKRQWDLATNLEPELKAKLEERPDIREKIAASVFAAIERHTKAGNMELAHDVASRLVERLPETPSAEKARKWLKEHEAAYEAKRAADEETKAKEVVKDEKKEVAAHEKILKPIRDVIVSSPAIADVIVKTPRQVYVVSQGTGETNLFFVGLNGNVIRHVYVRVTADLEAAYRSLRELMPESNITLHML